MCRFLRYCAVPLLNRLNPSGFPHCKLCAPCAFKWYVHSDHSSPKCDFKYKWATLIAVWINYNPRKSQYICTDCANSAHVSISWDGFLFSPSFSVQMHLKNECVRQERREDRRDTSPCPLRVALAASYQETTSLIPGIYNSSMRWTRPRANRDTNRPTSERVDRLIGRQSFQSLF